DLAGGGEQPGRDEADPGAHLPQHRSRYRQDETLPAQTPATGPGCPSRGDDDLAQVGRGVGDRFGNGHQSSRSVVKLGSNNASSTACTSTSLSISPACWSASPAPRIDSYWASPRAGVVKLVRAS